MVDTPLRKLSLDLAGGLALSDEYQSSVIAAISRAKKLNAFTSCLDDDELAAAAASPCPGAPLAHVIFSAKDNILTQNFPTTLGLEALRDFNPGINAELISRLEKLGAVLVGKNNLPELCQSMTSNNPSFGAAMNPVDKRWIAGGSSSGSAIAVASGAVGFAVGSDTGGSVRIPASLCGCVGFRPSTGRYPTPGFVPVSPTFDAPGLLTSCCADALWLDALITESESALDTNSLALNTLRIGVPSGYFYEDLSTHVDAVMKEALGKLEGAGVTLVRENIEGVAEHNAKVGFPIAFYEMLRETAMFFTRHGSDMSLVKLIGEIQGPVEREAILAQLSGQAVDHSTYIRAVCEFYPAYVALIDDYFERHSLDAIVVPTTALEAVDQRPIGQDGELLLNNNKVSTFLSYIRNTEPFSNFGGPCISMPVAPKGDRPVGLELVGRRYRDLDLLHIAEAVETLFH